MRGKEPAATQQKAKVAPTAEASSSSCPVSLSAQQSGFITFLSKAQQGKQLDRAESAKRVLEAYQGCADPMLKRQMVQDFYSAGGARGTGLEVACKQSIVTKDLYRAQAWLIGHCARPLQTSGGLSVILSSGIGLLSERLLRQSFAFMGHLMRHCVPSAALILESGSWDIDLGRQRIPFRSAGRPARWEQLHHDYLGLPLYASIVDLHGEVSPDVRQLSAMLTADAPPFSLCDDDDDDDDDDDVVPGFGQDTFARHRQWWLSHKDAFVRDRLLAWRQIVQPQSSFNATSGSRSQL